MLLLLTGACAGPPARVAERPPDRPVPDVAHWNDVLSRQRFDGRPVEVLRRALGDDVRDEARIVWGGVGDQTVHFLLAGFVVISADVNAAERITGEPLARWTSAWPKTPDGYLDYPITQGP